ncbi:unnamed protein product [Rotaria sp. Silwood1]|nr:unnamed protein product [Rotaria sp. Silwood1]
MQAGQSINDNHYHLQWIDILSKVKEIKFSLEQFIQEYLLYEKVSIEFPFHTSVFIYLIQRIHPSKKEKESPFRIFLRLSNNLKLNSSMFFEQFQSIFSNGMKSQRYEMKDIIELFTWIRLQDQLFGQYFSHCSSNVNTDDLWDMFLKLCKLNIINSINQKHVISILTEKIPLTSVGTFHRYTKSAKTCLVTIKPEFCSHFIELFQKVFDGYIIKQFNYPQYSYQVSRTDCNDLLQIGLEMSSTNRLERPTHKDSKLYLET